MKRGWQTKRLGEVLERTETVDPHRSPKAEFDYIDVSSVSNQTFCIGETQRLKGKEAPSRARKLVRTNDILFATIRPTLQRIAIVPAILDKQVCSTGYFVLRPKPGIHHRFVFYSLFTKDFTSQMESLQKGASYPAVTDGNIRDQLLAFPPLPEQRRIVGLLDEAFAAIAAAKATAEQNLQNARALFESHLNAVFTRRGEGWVEKTLKEIANSNCTLSYGIVQPGKEQNNGLPIVRPTDLTTRVIQLHGLKRIDPKLARSYQRTALFGGELLLCVRGSTGVIAIASDELVGANVTRGIVPIRFNTAILNPHFGYYLLSSGDFQSQIREKTYGTALMQINIRDLRDITLSFPPLNKQNYIAKQLDALRAETSRLSSLYARKVAGLEELKKSLLHQAFAGEL